MKTTHLESKRHVEDDPDALEAQADNLRRQREALLERARELRSDRRNLPRSLKVIAVEMGLESSTRPLVEAAKAGKLEAWRVGGDERGELVTTLRAVEAYLAGQPAHVRKAPVETDDAYAAAVQRAKRSA